METIILDGNKKDLIEIIESHIAYLLASGYDSSNMELNTCYKFLIQLNETSEFLEELDI